MGMLLACATHGSSHEVGYSMRLDKCRSVGCQLPIYTDIDTAVTDNEVQPGPQIAQPHCTPHNAAGCSQRRARGMGTHAP